jgi:alpha-beta hydrolase superfamily lysophospholipase
MNTKLRNILATSSVPVLIGLTATAAFLNTGDDAVAKEQVAPDTPVTVQHKTTQVHHRTVEIEGQSIFYREAGPADAPTVLLLHGFPTSSHMFRNLIPALADKWHVVAPDYPGYGQSSMPSVDEFDYTFDHMAKLVESFTEKLGLDHYSL